MKKHFAVIIILLVVLIVAIPVVSYGAKSCAYCGQYFFLGDTKPISECLRLKRECIQVHDNIDKTNACMCAVDRSSYMQFLIQQAKQRTAHLFASWAMPFMPGIHLIDPDLRKEFFDPDTPLHRKAEISLGRSTDLIGGKAAAIISSLSNASKLADPNVSSKDKAMTVLGEVLPHMKGGDNIKTVIDFGQKAGELRQ